MIGDNAYTLTSYMLTPYKENGYLTEKQKHNYIQAVTRNIVEKKLESQVIMFHVYICSLKTLNL